MANSNVASNKHGHKAIYWKTPAGVWEQIPTSHNAANRTLTAVLDHLTEFGVMQAGQHRLFLPSVTDK